MCFAESTVAPACVVSEEVGALRRVLDEVRARPDAWQPLLDLLVCLHRLTPEALREHLRGRVHADEAEALRAGLRRLAAEEEPMPADERRRRVLRVGDELLARLQVPA